MASNFSEFFNTGTGFPLPGPYDYQRRLAGDPAVADAILDGPKSLAINVPTGAGKTAAAVLAWLWNRCGHPDGEHRKRWPRRLVYCLPMRVLVEQTVREVAGWLERLRMQDQVGLHVLMGGDVSKDWDLFPERDVILIGTQDMLLSRALNRGYALARARWPMHFAWMNNDCLWALDEVQLMGSGLSTSTQLQAWRNALTLPPDSEASAEEHGCPVFGPGYSWWMSATLRRDWLASNDFSRWLEALPTVDLVQADKRSGGLATRWRAKKTIKQGERPPEGRRRSRLLPRAGEEGYADALAEAIAKEHGDRAQLTLVILNTVNRALELYDRIESRKPRAEIRLIHSRFRPYEREGWASFLNRNAPLGPHGRIIVATQVVEAGVDISARALFTELAPWPSLVQRWGRANRSGEFGTKDDEAAEGATLQWLDVRTDEDESAEKPYELDDLGIARALLTGNVPEEMVKKGLLLEHGLCDASPEGLEAMLGFPEQVQRALFPFEPRYVPQSKDLFELFDTTPDLTGSDIDVGPFIRDGKELDVLVFWRDLEPSTDLRKVKPARNELCPVPFYLFGKDLTSLAEGGSVWRWDYLAAGWAKLSKGQQEKVFPGQVFLLERSCGGYDARRGWTGAPTDIPPLVKPAAPAPKNDGDEAEDAEGLSEREWKSVAKHCAEVLADLDDRLLAQLHDTGLTPHRPVLRLAARLHDWGKATIWFQAKIKDEDRERAVQEGHIAQDEAHQLAKAPQPAWRRDRRLPRPGFRHEVASALAVLESVFRAAPGHKAFATAYAEVLREAGSEPELPEEALSLDGVVGELAVLSAEQLDLLAYLIAAHHGKVRLSLRASPKDAEASGECDPADEPCPPDKRQARGVRDGDTIPGCCVPDEGGEPVAVPSVSLTLEPMEAGLSARYGPSWQSRMLRLRDTLGPFRLAYLEALLRAADGKASEDGQVACS